MASPLDLAQGDHSMYNEPMLSDIKVKFCRQEIYAHKVVLARKSGYFYKAFTGLFSVATSTEIDLGDEDDALAITAMLRHIYELPYDQIIDQDPDVKNENLIFHVNTFVAADKYDVPTLRTSVVETFKALMETSWESEEFAQAIKSVWRHGSPADHSLQLAAGEFCSGHVRELIQQEQFKEMIETEEPFLGNMLTKMLELPSQQMKIWQCSQCQNFKARRDAACCHYGNSRRYATELALWMG